MKLTIGNTTVRQNQQGLYSLADLHKAAGGNKKHKPGNWLRSDRSKRLIETLNAESAAQIRAALLAESQQATSQSAPQIRGALFPAVEVVESGAYAQRGTWVCLELVYDYAMWVSPEFELRIIRAFHAMMTRPRLQHEKALTERHPFYPQLREEVLQGHTDAQIASVIGRSAGSVGYHRKKQFHEGFTDPVEYAHKRYSVPAAAKMIAKHQWELWGSSYEPQQATLNLNFGENA
jgi:hypothetical protein